MLLLINKPAGPTSHDIINQLRRLTGVRRVGHAGTLDPFAQGLLICAIGRQSTRLLRKFSSLDKSYLAVIRLGAFSDTDDLTGKKITAASDSLPGTDRLISVVAGFLGVSEQLPPAFSAKKINGRRAYSLARQGKIPQLKKQIIAVREIKIIKIWPDHSRLEIALTVSAGTYIRSLARDIGEKLACGAYLEQLTRSAIGPYQIQNAIRPDQLSPENWRHHCLPPSDDFLINDY